MALPEIQTALSGITAAMEIGSYIVKSEGALDRAILKTQIEEIIDKLSDAKKTIRDLEDTVFGKDQLIKELQESIENRRKTLGYMGARYYVGANGEPTGEPFCPTCFASRHKLIPLTAWSNTDRTNKCGECGNTVSSKQSPLDADYHIKANREAAENIGMSPNLVVRE